MDLIANNIIFEYEKITASKERSLLVPSVRQAYYDLCDLLSISLDDLQIQQLISKLPILSDLKKVHAEIHQATENEIASRYLLGQITNIFTDDWHDIGLSVILRRQAQQWENMGVNTHKEGFKIAMVGGGAVPQTQITLSEIMDCEVTNIDIDPLAVDLCREVLAKMDRSDLPVIEADGLIVDYSPYDLVIIATLVPDKNRIAQRVYETSSAVLNVRGPKGLHKLWRTAPDIHGIETQGYQLQDHWQPAACNIESYTFSKVAD